MKCIRQYDYGGPEVLKLEELRLDPVGQNEVLIKITYSAINHFDILSRSGKKPAKVLPRIPGIDAVGVIVESKSKKFKTGDRVIVLGRLMGNGGPGAYATHAILPDTEVFKIPTYADGSEVPDQDLVSLGLAAMTAFYAIHSKCSLKAGQNLLIQGASGGVASYALLFAKFKGLNVYATTSSDEKAQKLYELGARHVSNYKQAGWQQELKHYLQKTRDKDVPPTMSQMDSQVFVGGVSRPRDIKGFDGVLNAAGGPSIQEGLRMLKPGGEMLTIGTTTYNPEVTFDLFEFLCQEWVMKGVHISPHTGEERIAMLKEILELFKKHGCTPLIDKTFKLEEIAKAHAYVESHQHFGRVLVDCG